MHHPSTRSSTPQPGFSPSLALGLAPAWQSPSSLVRMGISQRWLPPRQGPLPSAPPTGSVPLAQPPRALCSRLRAALCCNWLTALPLTLRCSAPHGRGALRPLAVVGMPLMPCPRGDRGVLGPRREGLGRVRGAAAGFARPGGPLSHGSEPRLRAGSAGRGGLCSAATRPARLRPLIRAPSVTMGVTRHH